MKSIGVNPNFCGAYSCVIEDGYFQHTFAGYKNKNTLSLIDSRTLFKLGDYVQPLLAMRCAQLYIEEKLDLFSYIPDILPELLSEAQYKVRIIDLLTHCSGFYGPQIYHPEQYLTWEDISVFFKNRTHFAPPGTVWAPNSINYAIVGALLVKITNCSIYQLISELLSPAHISSSKKHINHDGAHGHFLGVDGKLSCSFSALRSNSVFEANSSNLYCDMHIYGRIPALLSGPLLPDVISDEAFRIYSADHIVVNPTATVGSPVQTPSGFGLGIAKFGQEVGLDEQGMNSFARTRWWPELGYGYQVYLNCTDPVSLDILSGSFVPDPNFMANARIPLAMMPDLDDITGYYKNTAKLGNYVFAERKGEQISLLINRHGQVPIFVHCASAGSTSDLRISHSDVSNISLGFGRLPNNNLYINIDKELYVRV